MGGITAVRGAVSCLIRLTNALGLTFPFEASGVNGWTRRLLAHVVQPRIPFEVAQLVHFDYHAKNTRSVFVLATCASVWFPFLGMCRDTHIQRSYLIKKCDHAWIFHCIAGKDKSKPFEWVIPENTISGTTCSHKMMSSVRTNPPRGGVPYLLAQFGPNASDSMSAEYWRDRAATPTQLNKQKVNLMKEKPLEFDIGDGASYAVRRAGPGILTLLDAPSTLRNAFGNWKVASITRKEQSDRADRYSETQLQVSFKAKFLVAEAIRRTIKEKGCTTFGWGAL